MRSQKKISNVGVLKKNLSVFVRKKNLKCPKKKNFQSVKKGKMFKCGISGVRKKNERKVLRKDFWVEILLSSCSLVRLYVYFASLSYREKKWKFSKCFSKRFEVKLRFAKTGKSWLGVVLIEKFNHMN